MLTVTRSLLSSPGHLWAISKFYQLYYQNTSGAHPSLTSITLVQSLLCLTWMTVTTSSLNSPECTLTLCHPSPLGTRVKAEVRSLLCSRPPTGFPIPLQKRKPRQGPPESPSLAFATWPPLLCHSLPPGRTASAPLDAPRLLTPSAILPQGLCPSSAVGLSAAGGSPRPHSREAFSWPFHLKQRSLRHLLSSSLSAPAPHSLTHFVCFPRPPRAAGRGLSLFWSVLGARPLARGRCSVSSICYRITCL